MSWFSQNYEKAAIGGAAVVALGLAFLGWSKVGGIEEEFNAHPVGRGNNDPSVNGADLVTQALASKALDRTWTPSEVDGRPVNLFTGVPYFVSRDEPTKGFDLLKAPPVHPPIDNAWWVEHNLEPNYADSPHRDPDNDGFSNLEEFQAKTDPNDPASHPSLIDKLMYQRDESVTWLLRPGFESDGGFTFTYEDTAGGQNRATATSVVTPGSLFFTEGAAQNRFKLIGSANRDVQNERTGSSRSLTFVTIEDQRPNKKGKTYEIQAMFPRDRPAEFANYDRSAVFSLEALGLEGQEFKIEENTEFALPPSSEAKSYFLKSVSPDSVEVEYTDPAGGKQTITIRKGSLPNQ